MFKEFSSRRSTRLGFNSLLMIALLATILGILNFLASRHNVRWDLSETKRFTLAPQTARILRELPREVKATVFTSDQSPSRLAYQDLFNTYRAHTSKLTVEFVDPEKKPGLARRYGLTRSDTAVLESGKQETRISAATEQELTNALVRVTKDDRKHLYFLTGHGEHALDGADKDGYSFLKDALERQGYLVRPLSLYEAKTIPADASLVVLGGPQRPVAHEEQGLIGAYVKGGGRLMVLWDPGSRAGLDGLLTGWGLQAENRTVLDTQTILGGDLTMPVVNSYGTHEITQDLSGMFTMFPHARPITLPSGKDTAWEVHSLAQSSPRSWARAGDVGPGGASSGPPPSAMGPGGARGPVAPSNATGDGPPPAGTDRIRDFDPARDTPGPLVLAAVAVARVGGGEVRGTGLAGGGSPPGDQDSAQGGQRAAVLLVGDSDFASNAYLDFAGNSDFILHAVAWLAEEKGLVTIAPKDTAFGTLLLTAAQTNALFVFQVIFLPGLILARGFAVWRRRQRL
jgi:ABC-type uncharacterized transport system involved in gliding motility auxiliary subunit